MQGHGDCRRPLAAGRTQSHSSSYAQALRAHRGGRDSQAMATPAVVSWEEVEGSGNHGSWSWS